MKPIKIAFLGNSDISMAPLLALWFDERFHIEVIVTTKDRKVGRNHSQLEQTPTANFALKNAVNLIQTDNLNADYQKLAAYQFDILLTCSFGQIISDDVLKLPTFKALNIHTSLLPKGRGGAPIHWAIINEETETGWTLMEMVAKMDAGPYYIQEKVVIEKTETNSSLQKKLADSINTKLPTNLFDVFNNKIKSVKQDEKNVSYWLNIKTDDQLLDLKEQTAKQLDAKIRGLYQKPMAKLIYKEQAIKIVNATYLSKNSNNEIGTVIKVNKDGVFLQTKEGILVLKELILPGKKPQKVNQLVNGNFIFKN